MSTSPCSLAVINIIYRLTRANRQCGDAVVISDSRSQYHRYYSAFETRSPAFTEILALESRIAPEAHIAHSRVTVACATNFTITSLPILSGPLPQHSRFT
jgi:hypothetical protein